MAALRMLTFPKYFSVSVLVFMWIGLSVTDSPIPARSHRVAGVITGFVANIPNVIFNWSLIYGFFNMGIDGAPRATTLTRFIEMTMLVLS